MKATKSTSNAAALTERMKNAPVSPDRFGTKLLDGKKKRAVSPYSKTPSKAKKKEVRASQDLPAASQTHRQEELQPLTTPPSSDPASSSKKKNISKFLSKNTAKPKKVNKDIQSNSDSEKTQIIYHGAPPDSDS